MKKSNKNNPTTHSKVQAHCVYFIKLGQAGTWEKDCLERDQILRLGYVETDHSLCLKGDWDHIRKIFDSGKNKKSAATHHMNQVRKFYEGDVKCLWITFYAGKLYWCFSKPEIKKLKDGSKVRPVVGSWSSFSVGGSELKFENLSGHLLKTQAYRGTICEIRGKTKDYLLRKINDEVDPDVRKAMQSLRALEVSIKSVIQNLTPNDFETLVDLIFRNAGWQRVSILGRTQKDLDIELSSPVVNESAIVQIKSQSSPSTLNEYIDKFESWTHIDRFFYVTHTEKGQHLVPLKLRGKLIYWGVEEVAKLTVHSGLINWVIKKAG